LILGEQPLDGPLDSYLGRLQARTQSLGEGPRVGRFDVQDQEVEQGLPGWTADKGGRDASDGNPAGDCPAAERTVDFRAADVRSTRATPWNGSITGAYPARRRTSSMSAGDT
jgi:hypothetical protein